LITLKKRPVSNSLAFFYCISIGSEFWAMGLLLNAKKVDPLRLIPPCKPRNYYWLFRPGCTRGSTVFRFI